MDLYEFESNSSEQEGEQMDNNSSSGGCKTGTETLSTDHDNKPCKKTRTIKKVYEPLKDGNLYIRYQDDPQQYKRLRKKLQNRESATRVRNKKKDNMEGLSVQVVQLRKVNSELMLRNAQLETQNKSLKNQVEFLRGLVKPNFNQTSQSDPIDRYLNLSKDSTQMKPQEQFQSPFEDSVSPLNWVRSQSSSGSNSNWNTIFVLTIVVCLFVLPSDSTDNTVIAQETTSSIVSTAVPILETIFNYGKTVVKYAFLLGYLVYAGSFLYTKYFKRKLKKF